jgi:hypothetical protein
MRVRRGEKPEGAEGCMEVVHLQLISSLLLLLLLLSLLLLFVP